MNTVVTIESMAMDKGREEGMQKSRQEGREAGLEAGLEAGIGRNSERCRYRKDLRERGATWN